MKRFKRTPVSEPGHENTQAESQILARIDRLEYQLRAQVALREAIASIRPEVVVEAPPRLNEFVFTVKRDARGQISSIIAKGHAKL